MSKFLITTDGVVLRLNSNVLNCDGCYFVRKKVVRSGWSVPCPITRGFTPYSKACIGGGIWVEMDDEQ